MKKSPLKVSDPYRKNELSLKEGGSEVRILYQDGTQLIYDKIKNVDAYLNKIKNKDLISQVWVNGTQISIRELQRKP